ncbi:hypothetical protein MKW92_001966 [Papaver armeniacum]|nr:hypothetical protein MKW92_001966 [Papaver armeniacum]
MAFDVHLDCICRINLVIMTYPLKITLHGSGFKEKVENPTMFQITNSGTEASGVSYVKNLEGITTSTSRN